MTVEKQGVKLALAEAEARRVEGGVWFRLVLAGVGVSGVLSTDDARNLGKLLIDEARQPPPLPSTPPIPPKAGAK